LNEHLRKTLELVSILVKAISMNAVIQPILFPAPSSGQRTQADRLLRRRLSTPPAGRERRSSKGQQMRRDLKGDKDSLPLLAPHRQNTAQRVNHRIPAERFSGTVSKRRRVGMSLLSKRSRATPRKCREFGQNLPARKRWFNRNINYLVAGWGAGIRTWDWRSNLCI
jgi:hypothetical protein